MIFEIMIKKDNWAKGTDVGKSLNVTDLELSKIFNSFLQYPFIQERT